LERDMSAEYYADEYSFLPSVSNDDVAAAMGYDIGAPSSYFLPSSGSGSGSGSNNFLDTLSKSIASMGSGLMSPRGLFGLAGLLAGYLDRDKQGRGGVRLNLSPSKVKKQVVQGRYGPVSMTEYAADGGLMHAYATGGVLTGTKQNPLPMEDGGFVLTAKAVENGTPHGIRQLLPEAQMIRGPGTGTSDHIPATIAGNTPARVSNGEMYVPKAQVDAAGGAQALYALMRQLERSA
jgi:hypothetical protein